MLKKQSQLHIIKPDQFLGGVLRYTKIRAIKAYSVLDITINQKNYRGIRALKSNKMCIKLLSIKLDSPLCVEKYRLWKKIARSHCEVHICSSIGNFGGRKTIRNWIRDADILHSYIDNFDYLKALLARQQLNYPKLRHLSISIYSPKKTPLDHLKFLESYHYSKMLGRVVFRIYSIDMIDLYSFSEYYSKKNLNFDVKLKLTFLNFMNLERLLKMSDPLRSVLTHEALIFHDMHSWNEICHLSLRMMGTISSPYEVFSLLTLLASLENLKSFFFFSMQKLSQNLSDTLLNKIIANGGMRGIENKFLEAMYIDCSDQDFFQLFWYLYFTLSKNIDSLQIVLPGKISNQMKTWFKARPSLRNLGMSKTENFPDIHELSSCRSLVTLFLNGGTLEKSDLQSITQLLTQLPLLNSLKLDFETYKADQLILQKLSKSIGGCHSLIYLMFVGKISPRANPKFVCPMLKSLNLKTVMINLRCLRLRSYQRKAIDKLISIRGRFEYACIQLNTYSRSYAHDGFPYWNPRSIFNRNE